VALIFLEGQEKPAMSLWIENRIGNDECRDVTYSRVTIVTVMNVK
jgi:hypothetical protein